MKQRVVDLLKPRYKVIADYPRSHFSVGNTLEFRLVGNDWLHTYARHDGRYDIGVLELAEYPHLFRRLEWWEERELPSLPGYIKYHGNRSTPFFYYKVLEWRQGYQGQPEAKIDKDGWMCITKAIPATEAQYLTYQNERK